jgi:putative spermidine/putrescine transport system substrate-binding protein
LTRSSFAEKLLDVDEWRPVSRIQHRTEKQMSSFQIDRRDLIVGGAAFAASLGGANLTGGPAYAQAATLRVTHFGGPYQALAEIAGKPFEQATKTRVVYDVEISPTVIAKLQSQRGDPPFDVVMVSRAWGLRAMKAGLVQKVSATDFSESANVLKDVLPDGGWGISMMMDTMDIMVDTKQVTTPLTSWTDLWRTDLKGKVMLPSATEGATCLSFLLSLIHAVGGDIKNEAAVNETFSRLKTLKPNLRGFFSEGAQANMLIERGDIAVAPQFAIRIANSTRRSPQVVKVSPREGMVAVPYDLCIPEGVKNVAGAKAYINFALGKAVQEGVVKTLLATPVRADVSVPPDVAPLVNTDPKLVWFQDSEYTASKEREWLDRYTREVQS